jgi:hypothetical protein
MYRNIDDDIKLFKFAKRYHLEESLTIDQLKYVAKQDGYSEKEIELAINDYYWVHIHSKIIIERIFWFFLIPLSIVFMLIVIWS